MEQNEELNEQLEIVRKSKFFLLLFAAALFLSYFVISVQEKQILCAIESRDCSGLPDTCPPRIAAAVLSLWGLVFFYVLTSGTLRQPQANQRIRKENGLSYIASLLSLLSGSLRLYATLSDCTAPEETAAAEPELAPELELP